MHGNKSSTNLKLTPMCRKIVLFLSSNLYHIVIVLRSHYGSDVCMNFHY